MSPLAYWIHTPLAQALGRTLAHFVWEGALLAAVLMALRDAVPARRRYALACVILAAMPIAFVATFVAIWMRRPVAVTIPVHWTLMQASSAPIQAFTPRFTWSAVLPWVVPIWFAGVLFFYARGLAGWAAVQRLRRRGVCSPPSEWTQRVGQLAARLRISRPVALLESCLTDTPVLVGYLRPVILLPLGCLTGLSTAQVECILLHELAHVARHDYLVNLLQSVVEGLLFYHPAVWWASHVVRTERENCCDDRVVEVMGNARAYAATLAILEQRRALAPALAATGGNLMKRIRRLTADTGNAPVSAAPAISAGLLLVMVVAAVAAVPAKPRIMRPAPLAIAVQEPLPTPYQRWLAEDVAYIITSEERAEFQKLTTDKEREQFIESFWERHGGRAFREEHYGRIGYANEHFSGGWQSDRGRMYIIHGPPDTIESHTRKMVWTYRNVEDVEVDFEDPHGTGDFRMTTVGPNKIKGSAYQELLRFEAAKVIAREEHVERAQELLSQAVHELRQEDANVSIVMGSKVIGPGDVLDIAYGPVPDLGRLERAIAVKEAECAALQKKYMPQFPQVQECLAQVQTLRDQYAHEVQRVSLGAQSPQSATELEQLQMLPVRLKLAIETMHTRVQANLAGSDPAPVTVNNDGTITLEGRTLKAIGLTAAQLETAIGPGATVRIEGSAAQLLTVVIPLGSTRNEFHVFAEVTVNQKIVQTFEEDCVGQQSLSKTLTLRPRSYQLNVVMKNMTTGVTKSSTLDFTVE